MEILAPPQVIGLPGKFTGWRRNQPDAILKVIGNEKRVILSICPTGFGKSVSVIASGIMLGARTVVLTSTKALQDQYMNDFAEIGMVDVRGKNSYRCLESKGRLSCDMGMCNFGMQCPLRQSGCEYYDAVRRARLAPLVVTNYSFWLYSNTFGEGIGRAGLLVCDEGHDAPEEVADFLSVKLDRSDDVLLRILPPTPQELSMQEWKAWAANFANASEVDIEATQTEMREYGPDQYLIKKIFKLKRLHANLSVLAGMDVDNWVCNITPFDIEFAPISVSDQCQEILFRDAGKVIITSGSVNYKTADMLGIDNEECTVDEYPHSFPIENRLVYVIEAGGRMNATADGDTFNNWLKAADSIIEGRLDRKGIFHTTAYHRRDYVIAHSRFFAYMTSHERKDVMQKIQEFKNANPPRIFVSPSVTTGFDFPYDDCEYQILGKVPYPDTRNVITKARCDADKDYAPYIAMQQIVQACGRGCRAEDDFCENFVIDTNIKWFLRKYHEFAPQWFMDSVTSRMFAPPPAKKLERRRR